MRTGRGSLGLMRMRGKWCDWLADIGDSRRVLLSSCSMPTRDGWPVVTTPGDEGLPLTSFGLVEVVT
jgi:hypothetical protein